MCREYQDAEWDMKSDTYKADADIDEGRTDVYRNN